MTRPNATDGPADPDAIKAALVELGDAIGDREPPCWAAPDAWFAPNPDEAIRACLTDCHALAECRTYTDAVQPTAGTWAGLTFDAAPKRKRTAA